MSECFFNELAEACKFNKKDTPSQMFSCQICEIFENTFFVKDLQWLILKVSENLTLNTILTVRMHVCIIIKIKLLAAAKIAFSYFLPSCNTTNTHQSSLNLSWTVIITSSFKLYCINKSI